MKHWNVSIKNWLNSDLTSNFNSVEYFTMKTKRAIYFCKDYNGFECLFWMQQDDADERNKESGKEDYTFICHGRKITKRRIVGTDGHIYELFPDCSLKVLTTPL